MIEQIPEQRRASESIKENKSTLFSRILHYELTLDDIPAVVELTGLNASVVEGYIIDQAPEAIIKTLIESGVLEEVE